MREVINNIFDKEVTSALDGFPSVYSKDDLICVVNRIRLELNELDFTSNTLTELKFQEFNASVRDRLETFIYQNDVVDLDSAELSLDYDRRVIVENIDVDVTTIVEELDDILLDSFQRHFGDLICEDE